MRPGARAGPPGRSPNNANPVDPQSANRQPPAHHHNRGYTTAFHHQACSATRSSDLILQAQAHYHMFSLSATLVLRSARTALGPPETADDKHRLRLLADMIGRTLCDPREMERTAKATQEVPGDWAYRVPIGYGFDLLNGHWSRCARPKADLSDPTSGGNARHSADVLSRLARQLVAQ